MNNTTGQWSFFTAFPRSDYDIASDALNLIFGTSAVVLNFMLLLVLYRDPLKNFRTPMTVLVANLAITDTITGVFILARTVCWLWINHKEFSLTLLALHDIFYHGREWGIQCSLFTVMFITWERFFAVAFPIRFKIYVTKTRTFLLSLIGWLLSPILIALSMILADLSYRVFLFGVNILNYLMIILVALGYCSIYKALRKKEREIGRYNEPSGSPSNQSNPLNRASLTANKRLSNTFLVITIILMITVVPSTIMTTVHLGCSLECRERAVNLYFKLEPLWLVNFRANPLAYAFHLPIHRQAFLAVFGCKRRPSGNSNGNISTPQ